MYNSNASFYRFDVIFIRNSYKYDYNVFIDLFQYFTPYFYYIPKASLAAVIIAAVVFMMELHVFKPIWRTKSKHQIVIHYLFRFDQKCLS